MKKYIALRTNNGLFRSRGAGKGIGAGKGVGAGKQAGAGKGIGAGKHGGVRKGAGVFILLLLVVVPVRPCSMFKITFGGKTMVGNNEDAWRENSRIWFEVGRDGHYGAAYVGHDDGFPQGGLNEAGLAYDGFAVYGRVLKPVAGKEKVGGALADKVGFLTSIMQQCATVEEVQRFVNRYDRGVFNHGMLLFIDKKGDYLVVEVDTTILGHDAKYVLANFCPSLTPDPSTVTMGRYRRGVAFLSGKQDSSLRFCTAMMDTMHECRPRLGDGTTYTSIYDLSGGLIYLYFYHDYTHCVSFDLRRELAKGDHSLLMLSLFPPNAEYERFVRHKTPFNSHLLVGVLLGLGGFFLVSVFWLLVLWVKALMRPDAMRWRRYWLPGLVLVDLGLMYYLVNLLTDKTYYYFGQPGYFPAGLLGLLVVGLFFVRRLRPLYVVHLVCFGVLVGLFGYWGFYGG
jgi:hypothetical protein